MLYKYIADESIPYGDCHAIISTGDSLNIQDKVVFNVQTGKSYVIDNPDTLALIWKGCVEIPEDTIVEEDFFNEFGDGCPTTASIPSDLFVKLRDLGIIDDSKVRDHNVGSSNYSKHIIQPWSIWKDYDLNPWDADIVKRVLRTKKESGKSEIESRIMDYEKIIHICKERIRQLKCDRNE